MASGTLLNSVLIITALLMIFLLSCPKLRHSSMWQATLTPLSSIIGSGFLVMAPLLASVVGLFSPVVILGIVLLAYAIGSVIRFNILHVEPRSIEGTLSNTTKEIEYLGNIALGLAYMVAMAFYLSLLSSFLLNYIGFSDPTLERWLTTIIIIFIATTGYIRGLTGLEKMESLSMTVQLSIVVSLLIGLVVFGINFLLSGEALEFTYQDRSIPVQIQILAGALLVVQGFETSRFIGEKYTPKERVNSMRNAQIISGIIYVVSVILLMPVIQHINLIHVELPQIINVMGLVAVTLPIMLMIAAIMSQFSAAVADTGGAGGLLNENSNNRLSTNISYVGISLGAILLVWAVDLLEIITLASRAFAAYYFLQTLLALFYCYKDCPIESRMTTMNRALYMVLAIILVYVILFAIPAE